MQPKRYGTMIVSLVCLIALLGACTPTGESVSDTEPAQTTSSRVTTTTVPTLDWLLVASEDRDPFGMLAGPSGTIEIDTDRECVFLDMSDQQGGSPIPSPIIFVFGTQLIDDSEPYVRLPNGVKVNSGDTVSMTGGWIPAEYTTEIPFLAHLAIPETCWEETDEKREIFLVSPFPSAIEAGSTTSTTTTGTCGTADPAFRDWSFDGNATRDVEAWLFDGYQSEFLRVEDPVTGHSAFFFLRADGLFDPQGSPDLERAKEEFARGLVLPPGAVFSGYSTALVELWWDPDIQDAVFMVPRTNNGFTETEKWPAIPFGGHCH